MQSAIQSAPINMETRRSRFSRMWPDGTDNLAVSLRPTRTLCLCRAAFTQRSLAIWEKAFGPNIRRCCHCTLQTALPNRCLSALFTIRIRAQPHDRYRRCYSRLDLAGSFMASVLLALWPPSCSLELLHCFQENRIVKLARQPSSRKIDRREYAGRRCLHRQIASILSSPPLSRSSMLQRTVPPPLAYNREGNTPIGDTHEQDRSRASLGGG